MDKKKHTQNLFKGTNHKYFSSYQRLYQCEIQLQPKIQITQQHDKSKLKNTYRIKEKTVKGNHLYHFII